MFNSEWYNSLTRPFLAPPDWIFAPVWSILYLLMFGSLATYIFSYGENKLLGYLYFIIQLCLNFLWSPIVFGARNIGFALAIIIVLDIFVILTIRKFYSISKIAGILLIPYLIWIIFATYLNIGYFVLN